MTTRTTEATPAEAEAPAELEEYRPHRKWYQRADIMGPLIPIVLGYVFLTVAVQSPNAYTPQMDAPGGLVIFDWQFFFSMVPLMLQALLVTLKGTLLGFALAIVLGFFLALGRRSQHAWLKWPTSFVIEFIRSTPLLVQLVFWQAFFRLSDSFNPSPITTLMIGLGIHYATYCSEAYRAGINSVDKGQWEAATALNLGSVTKWSRVVVPQAVPNVLPALGNFLVASFKDAPMGIAVNVHGLLYFADTVRADTFRDTEPYLLIGVGFLMMSLPAAWAVRKLERRISYERV
jgi:polar amino acid transport system permease protein